MQNVTFFKARHNFLKTYFFLSLIVQSNNLGLNVRKWGSLNIIRNSILKFIRPSANSVFNSHNSKAITFITRLRLVMSHLRENKFMHSVQDLLNPISNFGLHVDLSSRYLLHYPTWNTEKLTLLSTLNCIDNNTNFD